MSNLMASFNAGVSGLSSAQTSLTTTAHNLANARTEGYTRQQVMVTDSFYQNSKGRYDNLLQVGTGTVVALTRQVRNNFLDAQYRVQLGRQSFYEANQKATMEIQDMLGELQGEEFSGYINSLYAAFSALSNSADSLVNKEEVVSVASQFLESATVLQQQLNTYQTSLNTEVSKQVQSINDIVTQIKDYNQLIRKYEAVGESANDYRDKRNELLDQLGQYITYDVTEESDGTVMIYSNGGYLLDQNTQYFLATAYESDTSKLLKPVWQQGDDFFINDSLAYSSANNTDIGSLKGLMVARGNYSAKYTDCPVKPTEDQFKDENGVVDRLAYNLALDDYQKQLDVYNDSVGASVIMTLQCQLDTLVNRVVTMINDALCPNKEIQIQDADGNTKTIHVLDEENALIGDDANKTMGTELFARRSCERYTKQTVNVVNEDGTVSQQEVMVYNEEDASDPYSLYTLNQLVINPTILQDASTLPTMYNDNSEFRGGYAFNEILAIANAFNNDIGTLDPNSETTYNVFNFYNGMVSQLSTTGNVWNSIVENQELTVSSLEVERQKVMGVSSEEELSNLIKFQQCYNASSRYITTVSEMLEYLIERLGS